MENAGGVCDSLEVRQTRVSKIENTIAALPDDLAAYFEISTGENFPELLSTLAIKGSGQRSATGGRPGRIFRDTGNNTICTYMHGRQRAFKATAGLHQPATSLRPLTYAADAPKGTMHGFLNVMLMTAFAAKARVALLEE